jgi:hypothetical protein
MVVPLKLKGILYFELNGQYSLKNLHKMLTGYILILMQVECLAGCQPDPKLYSAGFAAPFPVKFTRRQLVMCCLPAVHEHNIT